MTKSKILPLVVLSLVSARFVVAQDGVADGVQVPQKLVIEVEVPSPVSEVWHAFSTSAGLSTWLTPNAVVELRPGGEWTAHFPGGSTGGGTIVSFVRKEIVLAALAPEQVSPRSRRARTRATFQFEPCGTSLWSA
jgi:uncharacterized protein YndB with AHSA1/START domain